MFQPGDEGSFKTAADLSTKQYYITKLDSSGNLVLAAAATDAIIGVINDPGRLSGDTASVQFLNGSGTFKVKVGAVDIAKDAYITTNASGQAVATTNAGDRVIGRAIRAATALSVMEYIKLNEKY